MNSIQSYIPQATSLPFDVTAQPGFEIKSKSEALMRDGQEKIEKMATDFESVFVSLMLKEMRNTLDDGDGGLFGGEGSDTFGGMFDMFMGQHLAEASPLGIADAIKGFVNNIPLDPGQDSDSSQTDETA